MRLRKPRLGIALGSSSARGWAHIGVLQALEQNRHRAGYSVRNLDRRTGRRGLRQRPAGPLEEWVAQIDWWRKSSATWTPESRRRGRRAADARAFGRRVEDVPIESPCQTVRRGGRRSADRSRVWFQNGSLLEAVRASIALPGLFSPVRFQERWLVDSGLVDPLPVSLCRALGAEQVIAVNLNGDIVSRHLSRTIDASSRPRITAGTAEHRLADGVGERCDRLSPPEKEEDEPPACST